MVTCRPAGGYYCGAATAATLVYFATFFYGVLHHELVLEPMQTPPSPIPTTLQIFLHNVVALSPLWAGIFSFGSVTLFWLVFQGVVHGAQVGASGYPLYQAIMLLLPHGAFEAPAILLAATFGIVPAVALKWNCIYVPKQLGGWVLVWLLLLAVAAWLEGGGV